MNDQHENSQPPVAADRRPGPAIISLTAVAIIAALAVGFSYQATHERIEANRLARSLQVVGQVLASRPHNNQPHLDTIRLRAPDWLGSEAALPVYRARQNGELVAVALTVIAPDAYVGDVRLLVGIDASGRLLSIGILEHRETPGLGDKIDPDKSAWLQMFAGQQLSDGKWQLRRDGGRFDHISGATITSRAVVNAIRRTLELYTQYAGRISDQPSNTELSIS